MTRYPKIDFCNHFGGLYQCHALDAKMFLSLFTSCFLRYSKKPSKFLSSKSLLSDGRILSFLKSSLSFLGFAFRYSTIDFDRLLYCLCHPIIED